MRERVRGVGEVGSSGQVVTSLFRGIVEGNRLVPFCIDDAEEAERFIVGGAELVRVSAGHVNDIAETDFLPTVLQTHAAGAADHDHRVPVFMVLEGGVAARLDLEIANVKRQRLPRAQQAVTSDSAPTFVGRFVRGGCDPFPGIVSKAENLAR